MRIDMRHYFGHITVSFMMTLNKRSVLGNYKCVPLAVLFQSVFWLKSTSKKYFFNILVITQNVELHVGMTAMYF